MQQYNKRPSAALAQHSALAQHPAFARQQAPMPRSANGAFLHSAKTVGSLLPKVARKSFEKFGFSASKLLTDWPAIVGADLAGFTQPERIKWPRRHKDTQDATEGDIGRPGATMVLRVDGPRAIEVQHGGGQLIERVNAYFGYRAISELRILQAPLISSQSTEKPRQALRPRRIVSRSANTALRAALERLAAGVASRPAEACEPD